MPPSAHPRLTWDGAHLEAEGHWPVVEDLIAAARVMATALRTAERVAPPAPRDPPRKGTLVILDPDAAK